MPADPLFYVVGLSAVFVIGLGKGAFGGGLAILGVPLLALVVDPIEAAVMTAVLVSAMDLFALQAFPMRTWSLPDLAWLLPALVLGIGIGAVFFVLVDPRLVAFGIGVVTLWFAIGYFVRPRGEQPADATPVSPPKALFWGTLSGFTTFIAHAGGPPVNMYLLPRRLPKSIYAGTNIALFTLANAVKLVPYAWIGMAEPGVLWWKVLALLPAAPLGVWVGKLAHDRLDERRLYTACYLLVALAGANLLLDSARALFL